MGKLNWNLAQSTEPLLNDWPSVNHQLVYSNDARINAYGSKQLLESGFYRASCYLAGLGQDF